MNRVEHEILTRLGEMPGLLERTAAALSGAALGRRPARGGFSLVEHAWHLADLEREGYGVRLRRLLAEDRPHLPDFPGDRIARERDYLGSDPGLALALFDHARAQTLRQLGALEEAAWSRVGSQEGVGRVTLADVPGMMAAHDHEHVRELAALLEEIAPATPALATLRARAAAPPPAAPRAPSSRPAA